LNRTPSPWGGKFQDSREPEWRDVSQDQDYVVVYALNILRTHYTRAQRAMFAAARATATYADGPLRRAGRRDEAIASSSKTLAEAAREVGVIRQTVVNAKAILRNAAPEVTTAVEAGKLTLFSAKQIVKMVPKDAQPEAVLKVVAVVRGAHRLGGR
jgi:hypothetical protein